MLVITREVEQAIIIGKPGDVLTEPIVVVLCRIQPGHARQPGRARIGIKAALNIGVRREEIPPIELGQNVVEYDRTLDCGSLGHVSPGGIESAMRTVTDEQDATRAARFPKEHNDK
jgi:sRNA-binding carbon storage regulator CsrA